MKISRIFVLAVMSLGIMVNSCAEIEKPSGENKPQKPEVPEEKTNDLFWNLPSAGAEKTYPGSTTTFKPIKVKYSNSYSPVPSGAWRTAEARIVPNLVGYETKVKTDSQYKEITNQYGSYTKGEKFASTGRFYVTKSGERFWFVDPEGYPLLMRGVASFVQSPDKKFSDNQAFFVSHFQKELSKMAIHAVGAFAQPTYLDVNKHNATHADAPLPQAPSFGFLGAFKSKRGYAYPSNKSELKVGLVFCDGWEKFCVDYMKGSEFQPFLRNKNVFGFFSDNEINFSSMNTKLLAELLKDKSHPAGQAAQKFMEEKGASSVTSELNLEFVGIVAEKYYGAVRKAVDAVDPGLLYLGSRLHGTPKYMQTVIEAAGRHCDVISINYYSRWSPEPEFIANIAKWAPETPFMVTEFYTKSDDRFPSGKNKSGAGFMVEKQEDRAYAYQHFTLGLLEADNCVGWTWFRFQDDSCNKGIFKMDYRPWPYLEAAVKQVNQNVYNLIDFFQGK